MSDGVEWPVPERVGRVDDPGRDEGSPSGNVIGNPSVQEGGWQLPEGVQVGGVSGRQIVDALVGKRINMVARRGEDGISIEAEGAVLVFSRRHCALIEQRDG
jgi:hypothetical protein